MNITVASPKGYQPKESIVKEAKDEAAKQGSRVEITVDPKAAVKNADILYTDVWVSMGQEMEKKGFKEIFKSYQLNSALLKIADPQALVMHCLPAHRDEEITDEVMEGKSSVIFQQAENRLHIQKALLEMFLKKPKKPSRRP
jgi:ornithine carbamoyltransferase